VRICLCMRRCRLGDSWIYVCIYIFTSYEYFFRNIYLYISYFLVYFLFSYISIYIFFWRRCCLWDSWNFIHIIICMYVGSDVWVICEDWSQCLTRTTLFRHEFWKKLVLPWRPHNQWDRYSSTIRMLLPAKLCAAACRGNLAAARRKLLHLSTTLLVHHCIYIYVYIHTHTYTTFGGYMYTHTHIYTTFGGAGLLLWSKIAPPKMWERNLNDLMEIYSFSNISLAPLHTLDLRNQVWTPLFRNHCIHMNIYL